MCGMSVTSQRCIVFEWAFVVCLVSDWAGVWWCVCVRVVWVRHIVALGLRPVL